MGGLETNCRLRLNYASGAAGEIRLSRDWKTENRYTFFFEKGYARWTVNDANHLELYVDGLPVSVRGDLIPVTCQDQRITETGPARTNPQSFIEQVRNVAAAKRGHERLRIPAEEGVRSLRLIERCYENRQLMHMPWMSADEQNEAEQLAGNFGMEVAAR
jgi:hypothetical protein